MFGLLTCPIPMLLKAEIYKILTAFCQSPHIAANTWQLLESAQILSTAPIQAYTRTDIRLELEEIEAREELFPSINAFLTFLSTLITKSNVPDNLGMGLRPNNAPLGPQPYLHFVINSVFLKTLYRVYKNTDEKWQITNATLDIFHQVLTKFSADKVQSPGYLLFYELARDSPALRMLFFILNEACTHLLEHNIKNDPLLEQVALKCLRILLSIVKRQPVLIDMMKHNNLAVDQIGLEKFIMQINPKTNRTDYLCILFRLLQFNSTLVEHSSLVLDVLTSLSDYKLFSVQLLGMFVKSCTSVSDQTELVFAFVQLLESDDLLEVTQVESVKNSFKSVSVLGIFIFKFSFSSN